MWPLKTKEEHYQQYMHGIMELEDQIHADEREIEKRKRSIESKEERVKGLKQMADIYAPKYK